MTAVVRHVTEVASDPLLQLASWACTCGEAAVQAYARPGGEIVAIRLMRIMAEQHRDGLPCRDSAEDGGGRYAAHDWSEWAPRAQNVAPGAPRRIRYCRRCNHHEVQR